MKFFYALILSIFGQVWGEGQFLVYYGKAVGIDALRPYRWVVLEPQHQQVTLRTFASEGKVAFGYLNLGEVEKGTPWFDKIESKNLLLEENENWKGSYMIDVRNPAWAKLVIEEIVPFILFQGFNGLFLDTIDNAEYLETKDEKYKGMQEAMIKLIKAIKYHYPEVELMANRGFTLSNQIANDLYGLLGEGLFTEYNFKEKSYFWIPAEEQKFGINAMKEAQKINPKLTLFSVDYWEESDRAVIKSIYDKAKSEGFIPYVSTVELDRITPI